LKGTEGGSLQEVLLPYIPPFDVDAMFAYFRSHLVRGIEEVEGRTYRRSLGFRDAYGVIELEAGADASAFRLRVELEGEADTAGAVARCRHLLDLDRDPVEISSVLRHDPLLAPLVSARPGRRVAGTVDGFELAVRAILGQQVSVAGARTLIGRLVERLGEPLHSPRGAVTHVFPTPEAVAGGNLSGLGITGARIVALQALAGAVAGGRLDLRRGADTEATSTLLQALPGIGPWTAQYVAMRALGDPDAIPVADLGLRRALELHGLPGDPRSVALRAEAWRPWRAYGAHYLWATLPSQREAP
jgi:AraC family transcriptional regulator, regulatory protein of adaptative response / DNA-3-methyladenine glycosylase II